MTLAGIAAALLAAGPLVAQPLVLRNCVGDDVLRLHPGDDAALLDEADRAGMSAAIGSRYTPLGPGFSPARLLLWRRPQGDWVYVAVDLRPQRGACFSTTISAGAFPTETRALRLKYRLDGRPA